MKADLTYHHLRRIVRALTPPAGQPPRMHLPVPVHTTVIAEHLLRLCTAGVGEATVRVNTRSNLLGITRGRFSGAVIHPRQHLSSTSDDAVASPIGGM